MEERRKGGKESKTPKPVAVKNRLAAAWFIFILPPIHTISTFTSESWKLLKAAKFSLEVCLEPFSESRSASSGVLPTRNTPVQSIIVYKLITAHTQIFIKMFLSLVISYYRILRYEID